MRPVPATAVAFLCSETNATQVAVHRRHTQLFWDPSSFSSEKKCDFDQQDDHHDHFEEESAAPVEPVDHELIELACGLQFVIDQSAVIGYTDARRRQAVHAGIEHVT